MIAAVDGSKVLGKEDNTILRQMLYLSVSAAAQVNLIRIGTIMTNSRAKTITNMHIFFLFADMCCRTASFRSYYASCTFLFASSMFVSALFRFYPCSNTIFFISYCTLNAPTILSFICLISFYFISIIRS